MGAVVRKLIFPLQNHLVLEKCILPTEVAGHSEKPKLPTQNFF